MKFRVWSSFLINLIDIWMILSSTYFINIKYRENKYICDGEFID